MPAGWADQNQNAAMAVSASISLSSSTPLWGSDGLVVASSLIAFPPAAWCGPQQPPGPSADHGLCYQQAGCGVGSLLELLTLNGVQGVIHCRLETGEEDWSVGHLITVANRTSRMIGVVYEIGTSDGQWTE